MNALIQLLFILAFSRSPAPSQAPPPRDTFTAPAAVGEGSIAGVVTDERDGRPMRRVNVTLSGSMMGPARNASTDENGCRQGGTGRQWQTHRRSRYDVSTL